MLPSFATISAPDNAHIFGLLSSCVVCSPSTVVGGPGIVGSWTLNGTWQYAEVDAAGTTSSAQQPTVSGWTNPLQTTPLFPKSSMIGVNEEFAIEESCALTLLAPPPKSSTVTKSASATTASNPCAGLPILNNLTGNIAPHTIASDKKILSTLTQYAHTETFRDIIPVEMIAPTVLSSKDTTSYWPEIKNTLTMFSELNGGNANLIISFGNPLPAWMTPNQYCWIPPNSTPLIPNTQPTSGTPAWNALKNNMGYAIGGFVSAMAKDPDIGVWFKNHVLVEGFNEFDSVGTIGSSGCTPGQGTPALAADFQNGIQYVLNQNNVAVQTLMPSNGGNSQWLHDYYFTNNGSGLPNMHIYISALTAASAMKSVRVFVANAQNALPLKLRNRIYIGEVAEAESTPSCPAGSNWSLPDSLPTGITTGDTERQSFYASMIKDPIVTNAAEAKLFWRLYDLPSVTITDPNEGLHDPCELHDGFYDINNNGTDIMNSYYYGVDSLVKEGL